MGGMSKTYGRDRCFKITDTVIKMIDEHCKYINKCYKGKTSGRKLILQRISWKTMWNCLST